MMSGHNFLPQYNTSSQNETKIKLNEEMENGGENNVFSMASN